MTEPQPTKTADNYDIIRYLKHLYYDKNLGSVELYMKYGLPHMSHISDYFLSSLTAEEIDKVYCLESIEDMKKYHNNENIIHRVMPIDVARLMNYYVVNEEKHNKNVNILSNKIGYIKVDIKGKIFLVFFNICRIGEGSLITVDSTVTSNSVIYEVKADRYVIQTYIPTKSNPFVNITHINETSVEACIKELNKILKKKMKVKYSYPEIIMDFACVNGSYIKDKMLYAHAVDTIKEYSRVCLFNDIRLGYISSI